MTPKRWTSVVLVSAVVVAWAVIAASGATVPDRIDQVVTDVNNAISSPQGQAAIGIGSALWTPTALIASLVSAICALWFGLRRGAKRANP